VQKAVKTAASIKRRQLRWSCLWMRQNKTKLCWNATSAISTAPDFWQTQNLHFRAQLQTQRLSVTKVQHLHLNLTMHWKHRLSRLGRGRQGPTLKVRGGVGRVTWNEQGQGDVSAFDERNRRAAIGLARRLPVHLSATSLERKWSLS